MPSFLGMSGSGKSFFLARLLSTPSLFDRKIDKLVYCCPPNSSFRLHDTIEFLRSTVETFICLEGIPTDETDLDLDPMTHTMVVFEDMYVLCLSYDCICGQYDNYFQVPMCCAVEFLLRAHDKNVTSQCCVCAYNYTIPDTSRPVWVVYTSTVHTFCSLSLTLQPQHSCNFGETVLQ